MECPVCSVPLQPTAVADVVIDVCREGCGGIWFDGLELHRVERHLEAAPPPDVPPASGRLWTRKEQLRCPRCVEVVLRERFATALRQVRIDECAGCGGIWLDRGELDQILDEKSIIARSEGEVDPQARQAEAIFRVSGIESVQRAQRLGVGLRALDFMDFFTGGEGDRYEEFHQYYERVRSQLSRKRSP